MKKLLIVDTSEPFIEALISALKESHEIRYCSDIETALALLHAFEPDKMVINTSLQGGNCLRVLQYTDFMPSVILAVTRLVEPELLQALYDFGVCEIMRIPCKMDAVVGYLKSVDHMLCRPSRRADPLQIAYRQLRLLALPEGRNGFRQLCLSIAMYSEDPMQSLSKEVFPEVAKICGKDTQNQVESTVRKLLNDAWAQRNTAIWDSYFPGYRKCPTNKQFIAVLAGQLNDMYAFFPHAQNE